MHALQPLPHLLPKPEPLPEQNALTRLFWTIISPLITLVKNIISFGFNGYMQNKKLETANRERAFYKDLAEGLLERAKQERDDKQSARSTSRCAFNQLYTKTQTLSNVQASHTRLQAAHKKLQADSLFSAEEYSALERALDEISVEKDELSYCFNRALERIQTLHGIAQAKAEVAAFVKQSNEQIQQVMTIAKSQSKCVDLAVTQGIYKRNTSLSKQAQFEALIIRLVKLTTELSQEPKDEKSRSTKPRKQKKRCKTPPLPGCDESLCEDIKETPKRPLSIRKPTQQQFRTPRHTRPPTTPRTPRSARRRNNLYAHVTSKIQNGRRRRGSVSGIRATPPPSKQQGPSNVSSLGHRRRGSASDIFSPGSPDDGRLFFDTSQET